MSFKKRIAEKNPFYKAFLSCGSACDTLPISLGDQVFYPTIFSDILRPRRHSATRAREVAFMGISAVFLNVF